MLKKLLLSLAALFLILVGSLILLMGYVFNNPDSVFKAFNSVTEKIMQGQAYEENEEFFLQGIENLNISSRSVDVNIKIYSGSTLKISLHGKVPRYESGRFISQAAESDNLHLSFREPMASSWVQINVNGQETTQESDSSLNADVYVPESFKGNLIVTTQQGDVRLQVAKHLLYEWDLQSASGKIENSLGENEKPTSVINPAEVGHIKIQTQQGSIFVEPAL